MDLRLYRTWHWQNVSDRIGGRPDLVLKSRDELQYRDSDGAWKPVPIEEAPRPENPEEVRRRKEAEAMVDALGPAIDAALDRLFPSQNHST